MWLLGEEDPELPQALPDHAFILDPDAPATCSWLGVRLSSAYTRPGLYKIKRGKEGESWPD